ncbi:MAG: xanthine dehydrogenase small subunit [Sandaracinaceae bacterium]
MVSFTLNGRRVEADCDPNTTLLGWLRERGMTGSKEGCAEGECGACAVVLVRRDDDGKARLVPVNSCLFLLASAADQEIVTVEGVANGALHPVQDAMVRLGGSQCGYCTPGFIMSLFAEYYRPGREESGFDLESVAGNLCRCTGYRPIRDAGRSLPMVGEDDVWAKRLEQAPPTSSDVIIERESAEGTTRRYFRPTTLNEALALRASHPEARIVCGGTDLVVEMNQLMRRFDTILSLEAVEAMHSWDDADDALSIGGAVPLSTVEARIHGQIPILEALFPLFSSRLIRNRATLGGNIATASPIGDSPPALLALGAEVIAASEARGERTIPLSEFFTGYRQTALEPDELIVRVRIPKPFPTLQRFYKVSKRVHDDISTVAAGFGLDMDDDGNVTAARLAYGGIAATPVRAEAAEQALIGKPLSAESIAAARLALAGVYAPMTDQRGSADYRRAMIGSLLDKFLAEAGGAA